MMINLWACMEDDVEEAGYANSEEDYKDLST